MFISLIRGKPPTADHIAAASWVPHQPMTDLHPAGTASLSIDVAPDALHFVVSHDVLVGDAVVASHACDQPTGPALLRIDEVCFPVGAVAHRHTHAGAGIRYLVRGALRIEADDNTQTMQVGDAWFEAVQSPVRAVALQDQGVTSCVRAMIIPAAYAGKSTFQLCDPADADLPRLQTTHRHIDVPLQVDAG
jgi:quercetin dioxygenase-like cupin family protein